MTSTISIHPGASAVVCRHTLEVLISLAKPFSEHFLPWKESAASATSAASSASGSSSGKEFCYNELTNENLEFICQNEIPAQFVNHGKTRINQINKSWYEVTFYDTSESSIIIDLPINN